MSGFSITKIVGQSSWVYRMTLQNTLRSEQVRAVLLQQLLLLPMMCTCSKRRGQLLSLVLMAHNFTLKFAKPDCIGYDGLSGQTGGQKQVTSD